jgi:hypothetical protein
VVVVKESDMDQVNWGRTIGPNAPLWSEAQPEAAHAASEINDDDSPELMGGAFVSAICIVGITAAVALITWTIWSYW